MALPSTGVFAPYGYSRRMQSQNPALNSIHFFHTFGLLVHGSFTFIDDSMRNRE